MLCVSQKDECIGMEHIHDERYVFSSNRAIKMSTTVANTFRMNVMCSVYSEGRPMSAMGSDQSERQSNDECNMFSSK